MYTFKAETRLNKEMAPTKWRNNMVKLNYSVLVVLYILEEIINTITP